MSESKNFWLEIGGSERHRWEIIPLENKLEVEIAEAIVHDLRIDGRRAEVVDQDPYYSPISHESAQKLCAWVDGEYPEDFFEWTTLSELERAGWDFDEFFVCSCLDDYIKESVRMQNGGDFDVNVFKSMAEEGYQFYHYMPRGFFNEGSLWAIHKDDTISQEEFFSLEDPYTEKINELTLGEFIGYGLTRGVTLVEKPLALKQSTELSERKNGCKEIAPASPPKKKGGRKM